MRRERRPDTGEGHAKGAVVTYTRTLSPPAMYRNVAHVYWLGASLAHIRIQVTIMTHAPSTRQCSNSFVHTSLRNSSSACIRNAGTGAASTCLRSSRPKNSLCLRKSCPVRLISWKDRVAVTSSFDER
jgi:hypothetical protein